MDWLKFVKSTKAKNKILSWFKKEQKNENIEKGKELVDKELKRIGFEYGELFKSEYIQKAVDRYKYKNIEEMFEAIGFGANSATKVIAKLLREYRKEHEEDDLEQKIEELNKNKIAKKKPLNTDIIVHGIDNCLTKISKCCNPLPGDEIIGYITKGRGVTVHRKDCVNVHELLSDENRLIEVSWVGEKQTRYFAEIEIYGHDRGGLLLDVLKQIGTTKAKIMGVNTKINKEKVAIMEVSLEIENVEELNKTINALKMVGSVYEVRRKK